MVVSIMLAHIAGIIACLAGLSLALAYAVSDIRRRPGTRDEVKVRHAYSSCHALRKLCYHFLRAHSHEENLKVVAYI